MKQFGNGGFVFLYTLWYGSSYPVSDEIRAHYGTMEDHYRTFNWETQ